MPSNTLNWPGTNVPVNPPNPYAQPSLGMGTVGSTPVGVPGNLAGGGVTGYTPQAGGVPSVPNPVDTAGQAIAGNNQNFGGIAGLGAKANQFTQNALTGAYQAGLPGYQNLITAASGNIASNLAGQISPDVQRMLAQQAAERGVATGSPGSPNSNAALMQALGLTSLNLQNLGQTQLTQAINRTPIAQQFNPAQFYVTPEQQQAAQFGANLYASAPIPQYAQDAAMNALGRGVNQGQSATAPGAQQPTSPVSSILSRYGGTVGVPSMPTSPMGQSPQMGSQYYPGTDVQGLPNLDSILGPPATSYGQMTPDEADYLYGPGPDAPTDTSSFYPDMSMDSTSMDASNPDYWSFGG